MENQWNDENQNKFKQIKRKQMKLTKEILSIEEERKNVAKLCQAQIKPFSWTISSIMCVWNCLQMSQQSNLHLFLPLC